MNTTEKLRWHFNRKLYSIIYFLRFYFYPYAAIAGIKIPVNYNWSFPMLKALFNKDYEGGELHIIKQTIEPNDRIVEIGTGLGLISAYCAKKIGNERVKTFEANPLLEKRIMKLYRMNKVNPDLNIALVSDKEDRIKFYAEPKNIWASSLLKLSESAVEMTLKTVNINEIISAFNPNYLIIDIEGAEYDLLPMIDFSNINKLQIELHKKFFGKEKIDFLITLLNKKGLFEVKSLSSDEQYFFKKG